MHWLPLLALQARQPNWLSALLPPYLWLLPLEHPQLQACASSGLDLGALQGRNVLVDEDSGPLLPTMAANVFSELATLNHFHIAEQRVRIDT